MQFTDSSIIRAHRQAAAQKGGGSHLRPFSWRTELPGINATVDHRCLPLAIVPSPGQASDKAAVAELPATHPAPGDVFADRGYDARAILELIAVHGGRGHIPTRRDRKVQRSVDPAIYCQRNLVERFFNKPRTSERRHTLREIHPHLARGNPHGQLTSLDEVS